MSSPLTTNTNNNIANSPLHESNHQSGHLEKQIPTDNGLQNSTSIKERVVTENSNYNIINNLNFLKMIRNLITKIMNIFWKNNDKNETAPSNNSILVNDQQLDYEHDPQLEHGQLIEIERRLYDSLLNLNGEIDENQYKEYCSN